MSEHQFIYDAINEAIQLAAEDGLRRLVGLLEEEDGTACMAWPLEGEAIALIGFTPGWIVTGEGEVLAYLRPDQERMAN
jgi:hypothetical protein